MSPSIFTREQEDALTDYRKLPLSQLIELAKLAEMRAKRHEGTTEYRAAAKTAEEMFKIVCYVAVEAACPF